MDDGWFHFERCNARPRGRGSIVEFGKRRFDDVELVRHQINLFNNPVVVEIEKQQDAVALGKK